MNKHELQFEGWIIYFWLNEKLKSFCEVLQLLIYFLLFSHVELLLINVYYYNYLWTDFMHTQFIWDIILAVNFMVVGVEKYLLLQLFIPFVLNI